MPTNARALTRLMLRERSTLLRLARRIVGSVAAAEDVTQTLWLRIQRVDNETRIANERAYLFRLATHIALDQLRTDRRRHSLFEQGTPCDDIADHQPLAEQRLLDRERLALVRVALENVSPRCREILYLRRIEGLSTADIATRLGISRQMVNRYIAQAMALCLSRLEGES